DLIITSNPDDRAHLMRLFGVDSNRLLVLPCGIDTERFKPVDRDKARKELSLQAKDKVLIYVGRLEPLKGIDTILMATADVADKSNLKFLIVGGNPDTDVEASRLLGIAKTLKIDHLVTFTGSVPHEKLATYYSAADVCLVPSYYESFGLVAVEAMACGTPVIASMVGGLKTTVVDGHNGYLIPWRCPEAFTERIEMLINNRPLRDSLGNQAKESIERLVWDRVANQVLRAYQSCLDNYLEPAGTA
ncbi:MAG: glycosyltransferase, partial [Dehalococcoidia bacterium]|nr:glycosyltransferase [Dehalococcoidia bacterium]